MNLPNVPDIFIAAFFPQLQQHQPPTSQIMDPEEPVSKLEESVSKNTDIALRMTKHLLMSTEGKDKNIVYSPVSIQVVLSMIAARTKGSTLTSCSLS